MLGFGAISEFSIGGLQGPSTPMIVKRVKTIRFVNDYSKLVLSNKNSTISTKLEYTTTSIRAKNSTVGIASKYSAIEIKNKFILKPK